MVEPATLYRLIGERIRQERERRQLTQDEMATRIGIGRTSLTNIEAGRQRVLLHVLYRAASVLELEPAQLLPSAAALSTTPAADALAGNPPPARQWAERLIRQRRSHAAKATKHSRAKGRGSATRMRPT